ncbi:MAG: GNAT family N-acetyltransferase [Hyphomicrobiales bacterium]|jgi:GNAT superfamily N-acetyltransferase|nr:GNAT family N-acetyltransferase [Hyphomicrobiales bacterium]
MTSVATFPGTHSADRLVIRANSHDFSDWTGLLALILRAFAYMDGRIDPPSSALALTPESLGHRAATETMLLACEGDRLVGCAFLADRGDHFYLGKLAVEPDCHGQGIGKALMQTAERHAITAGKTAIELQTRIELIENHRMFERLGFREIARTAHPGYKRHTSLTMRKALA